MLVALPDLHRHLDGSLRSETLDELARSSNVSVPEDLAFRPGMGLADALSRFAFTLSVLQTPEAVTRVAHEMCEDAEADGVTTLEIRFAPQLHRGAAIPDIVDAALEGAAGRAGVILCGLYGEPVALVEELVEVARTRPGVVGIDLAGGPAPSQTVTLEQYAPAFARARDLGIGRTVHAAEGRPAEEIRVAVEKLFAERIGHGTTLLEDARIVDLVLDRGVTLEACPTSNVHTGAIASLEAHPLPRWLALGVCACICSDNTLLSAVTARREHENTLRMPGMTEALLARAIEHGHSAAFRR